MMSDSWIRSGFRKKAVITLAPSLIYLKRWVNHAGEWVGVTIDFELANDIHYDLGYTDWLNYLQKQFDLDGDMEFEAALFDYFETHGWFDFENSLKKLGIQFDKIASY